MSFERVEKYPVRTERGEYFVSISEDENFYNAFIARVYVLRKTNRLFKPKFVLLREQFSHKIREDKKDLIGFAKRAVNNYEQELGQQQRQEVSEVQARHAFEKWDGDMR